MNLGQVWRSCPGWLLAGYALLMLSVLVYVWILQAVMGANSPLGVNLIEMLISLGLAWLVWCRSRRAWWVLTALSVCALFLLIAASDLTASDFPVWLLFVAHVAILLSPAVRTHVGRPSVSIPIVRRGWRRTQTPQPRGAEPGGAE